jgi:phytanoyl-CoA hydroxylase
MLKESQLKHYEEEGYIIFENLFSAPEIDRIRAIVDDFDDESAQKLHSSNKNFISIPKQINFTGALNFKDPRLQQFIADPRFVDITTSILGPDVRLYHDASVYKRPEANRDFPWHQDNGYAPIDPLHYLTFWLALEDATVENGCVWVMPGTHLQGFVNHWRTDIGNVCYDGEDPGIPVELKKGSAVAFHSLLFHRSTPNQSQTTRKGYVIQYSVLGSKNPNNGMEYKRGPVIAINGQPAYLGFVTPEQC